MPGSGYRKTDLGFPLNNRRSVAMPNPAAGVFFLLFFFKYNQFQGSKLQQYYGGP